VNIPAPIEDPNGQGTWFWGFVPGSGWSYVLLPPKAPPPDGGTTPPPVDPNAPHPDQTLPGDLPPDPNAPPQPPPV
jgi:hypothetical protein